MLKLSAGSTMQNILPAALQYGRSLCMQEALSSAAFLAAISRMDSKYQMLLTLHDLLNIIYFTLIIHDSKLNFLRFAHVSVQEFLEIQPDLAAHRAHKLAATSLRMGLNSIIHCTASGKRNSFQVSLARTFCVHQYILNKYFEGGRNSRVT